MGRCRKAALGAGAGAEMPVPTLIGVAPDGVESPTVTLSLDASVALQGRAQDRVSASFLMLWMALHTRPQGQAQAAGTAGSCWRLAFLQRSSVLRTPSHDSPTTGQQAMQTAPWCRAPRRTCTRNL